MSEQQNVSLVQDAYAAYGRGDIPALLKLLSEDVTWISAGPPEIPMSGERHGTAKVAEFFSIVAETTELPTFETREFIAQGDRVVVLGYFAGRSKTTGRSLETHFAMAFRCRDGKIAEFRQYLDTANLAAAYAGTRTASA